MKLSIWEELDDSHVAKHDSLGTLASIAIRPSSLAPTFDKLLVSSGSEEEEVSDIATLGMSPTSRCSRGSHEI